jgi:hypothetical protein
MDRAFFGAIVLLASISACSVPVQSDEQPGTQPAEQVKMLESAREYTKAVKEFAESLDSVKAANVTISLQPPRCIVIISPGKGLKISARDVESIKDFVEKNTEIPRYNIMIGKGRR